jgi:hypothetical protein
MLQRLLVHTTLMMTNRYCQALGCYDAVESHKCYSLVDRLIHLGEGPYKVEATPITGKVKTRVEKIIRR